MKTVFGFACTGALALLTVTFVSTVQAEQEEACGQAVSAVIAIDQGHPWRPPFGVDRVGSPPLVHVELSTKQPLAQEYYVVAYREGQQIERILLTFQSNPKNYSSSPVAENPPLFAQAPLASIPTEVALHVQCEGRDEELVRRAVSWPEVEADAVARPDRRINPVDLGTILVPHDWLILTRRQSAVIEVVALSRGRDLPQAKVRAELAGSGEPIEVGLPLMGNQRSVTKLTLPIFANSDQATLHVSLTDGAHEVWRKSIRTMIVGRRPRWPAFGAVETKLRYDAPIVVTDPETGSVRPSIDYNAAWDAKLKDVVVFLPNGSRFVFWRGSSYVPFWASQYNTGISYQWAETNVPATEQDRDAKDTIVEPLFDKELRYSRVRIIESSASRIHVRWTYQLTDYRHKVYGDQATEDFYFYPDGFGTRVLTAPSLRGASFQFSEFIILTPQAAYPLQVLPSRMLEILSLESGRGGSVTFPVEMPVKPLTHQTLPRLGWAPEIPRWEPTLFRVFTHKDDHASAIYFHPRDISAVSFFPPFYDQGQLVTPAYWGNHWPLSRGGWTGETINGRVTITPGHNSVGGPIDGPVPWYEPPTEVYESISQRKMLDALGRPQDRVTRRLAWLIAYTDLPDDALRDWGKSFSIPPAVEIEGARLNDPSWSLERRALRVIAEQSAFTIRLAPQDRIINPVMEIDLPPGDLADVTIDGRSLSRDEYAWDGSVVWMRANIGHEGATIGVRFNAR